MTHLFEHSVRLRDSISINNYFAYWYTKWTRTRIFLHQSNFKRKWEINFSVDLNLKEHIQRAIHCNDCFNIQWKIRKKKFLYLCRRLIATLNIYLICTKSLRKNSNLIDGLKIKISWNIFIKNKLYFQNH